MGLKEEIAAAQQKGKLHSSIRRHAEGCFAVEVADNANAPELRPRDIVVIDPRAEPATGDFVYIEVRHTKSRHRTFRQYCEYAGAEIRLVPLNKAFRTYRFGVPGEPTIAILGIAVELSRSFSPSGARGAVGLAA